MTIDHRLSLRSRLLALVALIAAVLLVVAVLAGLAAASLDRAVDQRVEVIYPAAATISDLRSSVVNLETGERGYVVTQDESFLEPYTSGLPKIDEDVAKLRSWTDDLPGLGDEIDALTAALAQWRTEAAEPEIAAVRANRLFVARGLIENGTGKGLFEDVRGHLEDLQATVDEASTVNAARSRADQRHLRDVLVVGLLTVFGLVVALAILLTRWVTRPTDRLVASVGVVADGDFREAVDVRGPPEFAQIGDAVDRMRQRILSELDELERYNEALDQTGPVVQRLRSELAAGEFAPRDGVSVDGRVLAAEGLLAGDFYDLVEMPGGRFAVVVADVSGHGHQAGVLAIKVKYQLQAALQSGLGPSDALARVADRLGDTGDMFVTCALAVVDPSARRLEFASAGHVPGLMLLDGEQAPITLGSTGPLIGPFAGSWPSESWSFDGVGATVVLCSDGLLEARTTADEQFGFERFVGVVRTSGSPAEIVERCCAAARDHGGKRMVDDLTVVALRIDGTAST